MTEQNVPVVLVPKRGIPTDWERESCYLVSCGEGNTPSRACFDGPAYEPKDTNREDWSEDEWYIAFQIAEPRKIKLLQYRGGRATVWAPEGQYINHYYEPTGRVLEIDP